MSQSSENFSGCLICAAELVYHEQPRQTACAYCAKPFESQALCANGHYICDSCHGLPALELIEQTCVSSQEQDPLRLADILMKNPAVKMHGPEHHFLVPAVLISSYCSVNEMSERASLLALARKRADDVKGGFCGFHGTCGAAMGAGIAWSVLTGTTPLSKQEWGKGNLLTAACLMAIGEAGGPRCCKRDSYLALLTARDFLNRHLTANLPVGQLPVCSYSANNKECQGKACRFFPQG